LRRSLLFLAGLFLAASAHAQAPAEDRRLQGDAVVASQQRISVLLRERDEADAALKGAELASRDAAARLDEAKKRNDAAARALKDARQRSSSAGRAYSEESNALERLRNPAAPTRSASRTGDKRQ
jgi:hypothetical protein